MAKQKYPQSQSVTSTGAPATRKGRESYCSATLHAKRDSRRIEAEARDRAYQALTVKERIKLVKSRGGSVRELDRLINKLSKGVAN